MVSPPKSSLHDGDLLEDPQVYRKMVGRLLYLTHIRPDITFDVHLLSQFVSSSRQPHLLAVYHLLSYLKQESGLLLFYPSNISFQLRGFMDSDYGSCPDTRCSTT
ncbi:cysteine-rich RLK (RECEPTOR-like protein kinase) 8 [Hibiscus trionum]|uniref:Cysteine-rich RLK (RECEPTOR-like protein kinase) 8 n=1 Tax=Hibiscus trionum TaxID=183268 RepID=A0A9W7HY24_HIBTR|nr:cysteine-rich RLK (RECEPTOR-like protein kinase) 8 [Hibiscus trionum]